MKPFAWNSFSVIAALLLSLHSPSTQAFPWGPGSCGQGKVVGNPHLGTATGTVQEGGYELLVNGEVLTSSMQLSTDTTYTWELRVGSGNEPFFRGFLFYLQELTRTVDLLDVLTISEESQQNTKRMSRFGLPQCPINTIAAGHKNRENKQSVSGELHFDEAGEIEVSTTVVAMNGEDGNRWYNSEYTFFVTDSPPDLPEVTTEVPTSLPTKSPTSEPTSSPTKTPTTMPTTMPTKSPTTMPTKSPTKSPSSAPSLSPEAIVSNFPTTLKSKTPSSSPTGIPLANVDNSLASKQTNIPSVVVSNVTTSPSGAQTDTSSKVVTNIPSITTSSSPSIQPTNSPTEKMSNAPSISTSSSPSVTASEPPSTIQSSIPSETVSSAPSLVTSNFPSVTNRDVPSGTPSEVVSSGMSVTTEMPSVEASVDTSAAFTNPIFLVSLVCVAPILLLLMEIL